jgi:dipeptidase E
MNMRLYLSGGGVNEDSKILDSFFAKAVDKRKPLLYIPIAINTKKHTYSSCMEFIKGILNPLGIENIVMWTEKDEKKDFGDLHKFGGIYVGGGNTFYLLKYLKQTGLFERLKNVIQEDMPFYGGSAGAIICGDSVMPALLSDKNNVRLTSFEGMGLIRNYSLFCHYVPQQYSMLKDLSLNNNLNILALPENSGLYVSDSTIEVIGAGKVYLIGKEIKELKQDQFSK